MIEQGSPQMLISPSPRRRGRPPSIPEPRIQTTLYLTARYYQRIKHLAEQRFNGNFSAAANAILKRSFEG